MKKGDLFIVKKGISHKVSSKNECHIMLIENKSTLHTGEVVNEIKRLKNNKTTIVIAHRMSTLQYCDRIYKVDKGRISLYKQ